MNGRGRPQDRNCSERQFERGRRGGRGRGYSYGPSHAFAHSPQSLGYGSSSSGYERNGSYSRGYEENGSYSRGYEENGSYSRGYEENGSYSRGYEENGSSSRSSSSYLPRNGGRVNDNRYENGREARDESYDRSRERHEDYRVETGAFSHGYERNGLSSRGYERDGSSSGGYERNGSSSRGYERNDSSSRGYERDGSSSRGYQRNGSSSRGYERNGSSSRSSCSYVPWNGGRVNDNWHENGREARDESYDRSRERHEDHRVETGASSSSGRTSSRSNFRNGVNGGNNGASNRQYARDRPIENNENYRRHGNGRDMSVDQNRDAGNGSSDGASSGQESLVQPTEWSALRENSNNDNEVPEQRSERQSENRRQAKSTENSELAVRTGLVPGNHVITQILQTRPDPTASKQGTKGTPVKLVCNYFRVTKTSTWQLYLYRVDFTPEVQIRKLQSGLLHEQIKHHGRYLFDGTMLYMLAKLDKDVTEFVTKGNKDDQTYLIKVKLICVVPSGTYQYFHVWSTLLRKCEQMLGMQLLGRNYYDPVQRHNIPQHNLQLWPGFVTAIHQYERDILVCADICNKVMRTETVYDIMAKYRGDKPTILNKILGMTVLTTYSLKNKTYRIGDIDFNRSPLDTFPLNTGDEITFVDYFARRHNKIIRDRHQPLLIVRSSARQKRAGLGDTFALVPELCLATGFDDEMRTNNSLMKTVATFTRLNPKERIVRSQKLIQRLHNSQECREIFQDWNFQVDANPTQVTGRQLSKESVVFGNKKEFSTTSWSREFHTNHMFISQNLLNWVLIYPPGQRNQILRFYHIMEEVARGMNMNFSAKGPFLQEAKEDFKLETENGSRINYMKELEDARHKNPQIIVCVIPYQEENIYGRIKAYCIANGIPSQILVSKTIGQHVPNGQLRSVATKVAIQLNCKIGGVPWTLNIPRNIPHNGLMTIGFDVFHNVKDKRKKSRGAIVATWNGIDTGTKLMSQKYYSAVSSHISGNELSSDIALNVCQAIRAYLEQHGSVPESILFYRDGVGDGQIPYVKEVEINSILDALKGFYCDMEVPLTFIVVTKKTNTRFFVDNRGNYQNPQPGTVVDDVITMPEKQDFYLVSPWVGQGTVSPTNYNIILNNMGLSSDQLQKLTNLSTYLYYNWCGTIAVPAVVQYAHKLAFLVGNYGLTPPSNDLQRSLYFL